MSGSSGSNEGYLFDSAFGPGDTCTSVEQRAAAIEGSEAAGYPTGIPEGWDPADGGVMQVHVSCSDVFPGGVGTKSDPETSSQWLLANAHIDKGSKVWDLVMIELPTEPPAEEPPTEPPAEEPLSTATVPTNET